VSWSKHYILHSRSLEVENIGILDHMDWPAFSVSTDRIYGLCRPRIIVKFIFNFRTNFTQISSHSICMNIFHFWQLHMMTYLPLWLHFGRNSQNIFRFWKIFGTEVVMEYETRLFNQWFLTVRITVLHLWSLRLASRLRMSSPILSLPNMPPRHLNLKYENFTEFLK